MNWKAASLLALAGLMICLFLLLATRSLFANGPVTIAIQTAAALLMLWARVTFGIRSFHAAANPTEGVSGQRRDPTAISGIRSMRRFFISWRAG